MTLYLSLAFVLGILMIFVAGSEYTVARNSKSKKVSHYVFCISYLIMGIFWILEIIMRVAAAG